MEATETAIVFGGSGFIGRHLLRALIARGQRVYSADIRPLTPGISAVRSLICDVRKPIPSSLAADRVGHCTVYNLAAVHRTPGHPDRDYYETNVSGALNVTEYCRKAVVQRLLFTSSISVYGQDEDPKDESASPTPESAYGASKFQAEQIHRIWASEHDQRHLVTVRPAVIFGPGECGNFTRLANALRRRTFFYPGRKDTIKACGYVSELVRSMEFVLGLKRRELTYNFCYPEPYTIQEICETFHKVAGFPLPRGRIPYQALRSVAIAFEGLERAGVTTGIRRERIDKLVRSTNIVPRVLLDAGYDYATNLVTALATWRDETDGAFA